MNTSLEQAHALDADTGSHARLPSVPVVFTTQAETREQLVGIVRSASRQLAIWITDLNAGQLEDAGFIEAIKRFLLSRRQSRVRILTPQLPPDTAPKHALLAMAERLPASIEIRTANHPGLDAGELLVSDERGVYYRIHLDRWDGMADQDDPMVARFYLAQFNMAWRASVAALVAEPLASI